MTSLRQLEDMSASLAVELATQLYPPEHVFKEHGIDGQQAKQLLASPVFQSMLKTAKSEWESLGNTKSRVRAKARLALEEGLVHLYGILSDNTQVAAARVAAAKELKELASMGHDAETTGGGLPSIIINLGGSSVEVAPSNRRNVVEGDYEEVQPDGTGQNEAIEGIPNVVF